MRYLAFIVNLTTLILSVSNLLAVDPNCIRQQFDGIDYALYKTTDNKIVAWTDAEKTALISEHNKELTNVKFSTNSTSWFWTAADFMPCSATRDSDIALITLTFNLPLKMNDWFVPVLKNDKENNQVVTFLNDPMHRIPVGIIQINGYYLKYSSDSVLLK